MEKNWGSNFLNSLRAEFQYLQISDEEFEKLILEEIENVKNKNLNKQNKQLLIQKNIRKKLLQKTKLWIKDESILHLILANLIKKYSNIEKNPFY